MVVVKVAGIRLGHWRWGVFSYYACICICTVNDTWDIVKHSLIVGDRLVMK